MPLLKIKDFYPDYKDSVHTEWKDFSVYAQGDDKVGKVNDILVDDRDSRFRYFIVDTGSWIFGKKVLLPVGLAQVDYTNDRINVPTMMKSQVEDLPNFDDLEKVDYDYEEQVRGVYRPATTSAPTATSAAIPATTQPSYNQQSYSYDYDRDLYNLNDQNHNELKLYEERLIASKTRQKTGEVSIGKHVETNTARVEVPVEKERVVIERTTSTSGSPADPSSAFQEGEAARMNIYEETPDIRKEAFVREEVRVRKEVQQDVAMAEDTIRREELDVNTQGRPIINE